MRSAETKALAKILLLSWALFTMEFAFLRLFALSLPGVLSIAAISFTLLGIGAGVLWAGADEQAEVAGSRVLLDATSLVAGFTAVALLSSTSIITASVVRSRGFIDDLLGFSRLGMAWNSVDETMTLLVLTLTALSFVALGRKLALLSLSRTGTFTLRYAADLGGGALAALTFGLIVAPLGAPGLVALALCAGFAISHSFGSKRALAALLFFLISWHFSFFERPPFFFLHKQVLGQSWSSFGLSTAFCQRVNGAEDCLTEVNLSSPSSYNPVEPAIRKIGFELLEPEERGTFVDIACGAGRGMRTALDAGFSEVWGADIAVDRVRVVEKVFKDDARNPFLDPRAHFAPGDGRAFFRDHGSLMGSTDFIELAEHSSLGPLNLQSLTFSAERLNTVEAFAGYIDALSRNGVFFWITYVGAERHLLFMRRLNSLKRAWEFRSAEPFVDHVLLLRSQDWIAVALTKNAVGERRRDRTSELSRASGDMSTSGSDELLRRAGQLIGLSPGADIPGSFLSPFEFDFSPIRDSNPQGYTTLSLPRFLSEIYRGKFDRNRYAGPDMLRLTFVAASSCALALPVLALWLFSFFTRRGRQTPALLVAICFILGMNSMAAETALTELFASVLGTLERSFTCILTPFLLGAAFGSTRARARGVFASAGVFAQGVAAVLLCAAAVVLGRTDGGAIALTMLTSAAVGFFSCLPFPILASSLSASALATCYLAVFLGNVSGPWAALLLFYSSGRPGMEVGLLALTLLAGVLIAHYRRRRKAAREEAPHRGRALTP